MQHARLGPSSAHRWMTCPGSVAMIGAGPDRSSEAARRGTACHTLLGVWLRGDEIEHLIGLTEPETSIEITSEMVVMVKDTAKWLFHYVASYDPMPVVLNEKHIEVGRAFGCPDDLWGTADLVAVSAEEILIADAKFGFIDVDVEGNEQVSLYAIGEAEERGWPDVRYKLAILQPQSDPPWKVEVLSRAELEDRRQRYLPRVKAALQPSAPLVPTERGCEWCSAAGRCPALQRRAGEVASRLYADPPESLSVDALGEILDDAKLVRDALDAAERYALQTMTLGARVPGWKRVKARTHRQWTDPAAAEEMLLKAGAESEDIRPPPKLISPAQAEKLLNLPRRSLDDYAPAPEGEPVLARERDPRPALDSPYGHEE